MAIEQINANKAIAQAVPEVTRVAMQPIAVARGE